MSKRIVFLGAAAAAALWTAQPAAAADYPYGGDEFPAFRGRDEGREPGQAGGYRGAPGPVVFDERGPDRRFDGPRPGDGFRPGYDGPGDRRPVAIGRPAWGYGYGRPAFFAPGVDRPAPLYRPAAEPAFGEGSGGLDVGCTTEQVQSETPSGWRKTVTHRTCYRR